MTPHPAGRAAQVIGPSMQAAETSTPCGQRRMEGRSSSTTESACPLPQSAQTITVNGRSVPRGAGVTG